MTTGERLGPLARSTIECLGRSDALYHNFEHTLLVTLVGRDILQGLAPSKRIEPADYCHPSMFLEPTLGIPNV